MDDFKSEDLFQFKYCTIKRLLSDLGDLEFIEFQFKYCTIKRPVTLPKNKKKLNFNSSIVRLKGTVVKISHRQIIFQFKYCTIKRPLATAGR